MPDSKAKMGAKSSEVTFRPCVPEDIDVVVPLMLSSGPEVYRYVFSVDHQAQAEEFARYAFSKKKGQFSHRQHLAVLVDSRVVGVVGLATKKLSLQFFWAALVAIVSFYGVLRGIRVTLRGLRTESILKPPRADVGLIYNFAVASSMRGHGLGRALFSHACEHCRTLQLGRIGLDVARTNVRARALYDRLGFREVEQNEADFKNEFGHLATHDYMERGLEVDHLARRQLVS